MSTDGSYIDALDAIEDKARLTPEQIHQRRTAMDADVWLFIKWICGHGADDIERFHRPLAYLLAGDAVRLAASLNVYDSDVVTQIKRYLLARANPIDWNTRAGIRALHSNLRRINDRISRSMGKTVVGRDVILWVASGDPNKSILMVSKSDEAAWAMCEAIGNMMKSDAYRVYYPDRFYSVDPNSYISKKWIRLNGRTVAEQETIEARGINSQSFSRHYHLIYGDDMSSTEAKQGEATIEDANRFIASLHGLSIAERWGGTRYVFNGTIQGARDDHATLASNPDYLTIVIPIWRHTAGASWTLSNLLDDGIPVIPELYDADAIREMRRDTLANPKLGPISWLQNFCMTAHEAGSMEFSSELLRRSKFVWVSKKLTSHVTGKEEERRYIRRYLWTSQSNDGSSQRVPKIDPKLEKKANATCLCWYEGCSRLTSGQHAFYDFDPLALPRMLGGDQAVTGRGDKWAVAAGCQDPEGFKYALKGKAGRGRGYTDYINAIVVVFNRWGGTSNPPRKIGIESNAAQGVTADWMQRANEFSFLARRIVKLSPGQVAKEIRIFNYVLANMEMGLLLLDPEDADRDTEMLGYNSKQEDPEDDILDANAMMVVLFGSPGGELDMKSEVEYGREQAGQHARDVDGATGIDVSFDPMTFMWD